ncbi:uncharacterized protein LOC111375366 [Olea europaea var. sylvestris]|uniref:uncharacterized protein LOC111375366 n=1 Tax=Olea europaea var. sylvestris TaxID=158386 RepID=UPI000C1D47DF|nr:uncharacterized protein LOC111375366 [Olea europaea var. sylvestris]
MVRRLKFQKQPLTSLEQEKKKDVTEEKSVPNDDGIPKHKFPPLSEYKSVPPFSQALVEPRKDENNHELYESFRKREVNIPLLDAIKLVPYYDKFLKELCNTMFEKAMLDSGASINVMPYFVYVSLKLGPLNETGVIIQLVNKSNAYANGIVEDVLVKINDLVFPANFYVLDMGYSGQTIPILLGRPFLRTSKAKIDFYSGMLTMEFDDKISEFNIYDAMKHSDESNPVYSSQVIDNLEQEVLELDENNAMKLPLISILRM